jgi:uncharacterized iron-regulated protein
MLALALALALAAAAQDPGSSPPEPPGTSEQAPSQPREPRHAVEGSGSAGGEEARSPGAQGNEPLADQPPAAAEGQPAPKPGSAVSSLLPGALVDAEGQPLSRARFAALARSADFIVVGESHGSSCDHQVEASLIDALAALGLEPTIGLEMIAVDQQEEVDLFNQGRISVEGMGPALGWSWSWGDDYRLYAPIFEAARRNHLPVAALNTPCNVVSRVLIGKADPEHIRPSWLMPERIVLPLPAQGPSLRAAFEKHQRLQCIPRSMRGDGEEAWERFVLVQSIWDSMMAEKAIDAGLAHGGPVVVLAGEGHVEHGWGIPYRLTTFAPGARILTLLPWRGGPPPDPRAADLFFFCPSRSR